MSDMINNFNLQARASANRQAFQLNAKSASNDTSECGQAAVNGTGSTNKPSGDSIQLSSSNAADLKDSVTALQKEILSKQKELISSIDVKNADEKSMANTSSLFDKLSEMFENITNKFKSILGGDDKKNVSTNNKTESTQEPATKKQVDTNNPLEIPGKTHGESMTVNGDNYRWSALSQSWVPDLPGYFDDFNNKIAQDTSANLNQSTGKEKVQNNLPENYTAEQKILYELNKLPGKRDGELTEVNGKTYRWSAADNEWQSSWK